MSIDELISALEQAKTQVGAGGDAVVWIETRSLVLQYDMLRDIDPVCVIGVSGSANSFKLLKD